MQANTITLEDAMEYIDMYLTERFSEFRHKENPEKNIESMDRKEKLAKDNKKEDGYKSIKPKTSITTDQANDFWNNLFSNEIKEESFMASESVLNKIREKMKKKNGAKKDDKSITLPGSIGGVPCKLYNSQLPEGMTNDELIEKFKKDLKLAKTVNYKKEVVSFIKEHMGWYDEMDDIKTVSDVLKYGKLDYVSYFICKNKTDSIIEIWYNNFYNTKYSDKFFGGHSLTCTIRIKDDKIDEVSCGLQG